MSREINFKKNLKILSYFAKNILTNRFRYNIIIKPCRMTRLTYGGIAQLARAFGSYPECRWFESNCRYQFWPGGQEVKTPPFHGGNTSSILVRVTRATKQMSQSADQKFVRSGFWHLYFLGRVAQLVRALASHARGRRFESASLHQIRQKPCITWVIHGFWFFAGKSHEINSQTVQNVHTEDSKISFIPMFYLLDEVAT